MRRAVEEQNRSTEFFANSLIERLCDEFENACRSGSLPDTEEFLAQIPAPDREQLRQELEHIKEFWESRNQPTPREAPQSDSSLNNFQQETATNLPRLGSYKLLRKIGEGGMGCVYEAEHVHMQRRVALKTISQPLAASDEVAVRFRREVLASAKLSHPNIVTAHDAGEENGLLFLVMELVDGKDLKSLVKSREDSEVSVAEAIAWCTQAAEAVAYMHAQGMIHRDIKPANMIVTQSGTLKLLDLGLARIHRDWEDAEAAAHDLTGSSCAVGTVDFMAPEQAFDPKNVDERADIYALGCTLYFLLTKRAVFSGDNYFAKVLAHRDNTTPSLFGHRQDIPPQLETLFQEMVAKRPTDRCATMQDVIARLRNVEPITIPLEKPKRSFAWLGIAGGLLAFAILGVLLARNFYSATEHGEIGSTEEGGSHNTSTSEVIVIPATVNQNVAAWVLAQGGQVTVESEKQSRQISDVKDLPKGEFQLVEVDLSSTDTVDEDLQKLSGLHQLRNLQLGRTKIQGPGLKYLRALKSLTHLGLQENELQPESLQHLNELSTLHTLWLIGRTYSNEHLKQLNRLPQLHYLWLDFASVDDVGMEYVARQTELVGLGLNFTTVTDKGVKKLAPLGRLSQLQLGRTGISEATWNTLVELEELQSLDLSQTQCVGSDFSKLATIQGMTDLYLVDTKVSDADLDVLKQLKLLKLLDLSGTEVTPAGLAELQQALPHCTITQRN